MQREGFEDRQEAGAALAEAVAAEAARRGGLRDPLVLALPRGGVPVAHPVARRLDCPLDLVMVRKLGLPGHAELAAGALVDGLAPQVVFNPEVLRMAGLSQSDMRPVIDRELAEIERRRTIYLADRAPANPAGRDLFVVDDGVATGATMRAALKALKSREPTTVTVAVPVAPKDATSWLRTEADHLICLRTPVPFHAVGAHYRQFPQVADDEVIRLLAEA